LVKRKAEDEVKFRECSLPLSSEFFAFLNDPLCGLVVRVPVRIIVGLERGPLRLVRINEELLNLRSSGPCLENRN
jgi:hypothetical protein